MGYYLRGGSEFLHGLTLLDCGKHTDVEETVQRILRDQGNQYRVEQAVSLPTLLVQVQEEPCGN